jgi:hypothetical protein
MNSKEGSRAAAAASLTSSERAESKAEERRAPSLPTSWGGVSTAEVLEPYVQQVLHERAVPFAPLHHSGCHQWNDDSGIACNCPNCLNHFLQVQSLAHRLHANALLFLQGGAPQTDRREDNNPHLTLTKEGDLVINPTLDRTDMLPHAQYATGRLESTTSLRDARERQRTAAEEFYSSPAARDRTGGTPRRQYRHGRQEWPQQEDQDYARARRASSQHVAAHPAARSPFIDGGVLAQANTVKHTFTNKREQTETACGKYIFKFDINSRTPSQIKEFLRNTDKYRRVFNQAVDQMYRSDSWGYPFTPSGFLVSVLSIWSLPGPNGESTDGLSILYELINLLQEGEVQAHKVACRGSHFGDDRVCFSRKGLNRLEARKHPLPDGITALEFAQRITNPDSIFDAVRALVALDECGLAPQLRLENIAIEKGESIARLAFRFEETQHTITNHQTGGSSTFDNFSVAPVDRAKLVPRIITAIEKSHEERHKLAAIFIAEELEKVDTIDLVRGSLRSFARKIDKKVTRQQQLQSNGKAASYVTALRATVANQGQQLAKFERNNSKSINVKRAVHKMPANLTFPKSLAVALQQTQANPEALCQYHGYHKAGACFKQKCVRARCRNGTTHVNQACPHLPAAMKARCNGYPNNLGGPAVTGH